MHDIISIIIPRALKCRNIFCYELEKNQICQKINIHIKYYEFTANKCSCPTEKHRHVVM